MHLLDRAAGDQPSDEADDAVQQKPDDADIDQRQDDFAEQR